jgi:hypothetical protein
MPWGKKLPLYLHFLRQKVLLFVTIFLFEDAHLQSLQQRILLRRKLEGWRDSVLYLAL